MSATYTNGQLAKQANVPTTTIRYYERRGLLRPAARAGSGAYRTYDEDDIERAAPFLDELLELLPAIEAIVLVGRNAQRVAPQMNAGRVFVLPSKSYPIAYEAWHT